MKKRRAYLKELWQPDIGKVRSALEWECSSGAWKTMALTIKNGIMDNEKDSYYDNGVNDNDGNGDNNDNDDFDNGDDDDMMKVMMTMT